MCSSMRLRRGGCGCRNCRRRRAGRPRCLGRRRGMLAFRWRLVRCRRRWGRRGGRREASRGNRLGSRRVCLRRLECGRGFRGTNPRFRRRAVSSLVGLRSRLRRSRVGRESSDCSDQGVPRRRVICSFRRRRTSLQSPRFSVTLQISFTTPSLRDAISLAAASRKVSAAARDSSGSTNRNWPPPLEPRRIFAKPNSASRARGRISPSRLTQCERPVKAWSRSPPAGARRKSSIPRSLP